MSDKKISFSFGAKPSSNASAPASSSTAPASNDGGGMSNLERLMAQAKAKPPASKSAANGKAPSNANGKGKPGKPIVFGDEEEEETLGLPVKKKAARPPPNLYGPSDASSSSAPAPNAGPSSTSASASASASGSGSGPGQPLLSRAERRARDEALKLDASVYDYDAVYDSMKSAEAAVAEARKAASGAQGGPKYIESFLAAAATRKLDRLRAEEKMLERERAAEGDEFADKDKFVTEAYKKQMAEVRAAEAEEKAREGEYWPGGREVEIAGELADGTEALKKSNKGPGLTSLYASMLDDTAAKHAAAVAASSAPQPSGPSLAIRPPTQFDDQEEYDPLLAAEAKSHKLAAGTATINAETGKQIEINDDGEVVDKRSLLRAGLNITKKPAKPAGADLPPSLLAGRRSEAASSSDAPYVSRAVGAAASYQERMARERKRLAEQIRAEEEKKREAAAARTREEEEAARRRREGDDGEAARRRAEAKERFLQRKREREEEAARKKQKQE